jgi:LPS export ABC transporter protein LptC
MPPDPLGTLVRNTVVTLLLALVAAALWLATWQRQATTPPVERVDAARPLGYYVHGARMTGTDEQGRVAYRVLAGRLDEVPEENRLQLTDVSIEYHPPEDTAWSISAASASSPKGGSPLDLVGNVKVKSVPTDGAEPLTIDTEALRFWPETSIAETEAYVQIRVGSLQFDALGLRADLMADLLQLESQVHGTFAR